MRTGTISTLLLSVSLLWCGAAPAATPPPPETSLNNCQNAVRVQGKVFLQNYANAVGICLQRVSTEIVKKNAADASKAAKTCIAQFRKINDTRGQGKSLEEKLRAKIQDKCTPGGNNTHNVDDILGGSSPSVSEPLEAENIGNWCGQFGGSGEIASLSDWLGCIVNSYTLLARTAVTVSYPRALEYLDQVRPAMAAKSPPASDPTKVSDAVAGLDALNLAVEGLNNDDRPAMQTGASIPATGQSLTFGPGSDGDVQAGAPLRYVDNGDGTITDLNTGLMWEKKDQEPAGIHNWDNSYTWGMTTGAQTMNGTMMTNFLAALNTAPCFAGHCDWRIPNVSELQSLADYGSVFPPAVDTPFNTNCAPSCTVDGAGGTTMCSCTHGNGGPGYYYWSSTTYRHNTAWAWHVDFYDGALAGYSAMKSDHNYVRAVRGGS